MVLEAEFENCAQVVGGVEIFQCKKQQDCRIRRVRLQPRHPQALQESLEAIRAADLILLGPGVCTPTLFPICWWMAL